MDQAIKQKNKYVIIVLGEEWHKGVLGIIASRLVEIFNKPSIVISFNKDKGIGSARSLNFIDIGKIIMDAKNAGVIEEGGGHKMAAGLKVSMKKYSRFLMFLEDIFIKYDSSYFKKTILYDTILSVDEINIGLLEDIERLEPFGKGNPEPKFIIKNIYLELAKTIKERHVLIKFRNNSDLLLKGISFNCVDNDLGQNLLKSKNKKFDLGCSIKKDIYQSNIQPQLVIYDAMVIN